MSTPSMITYRRVSLWKWAIRYNVLCSYFGKNSGYSEWKPHLGVNSNSCGGRVETLEKTCTNLPSYNGGEDCRNVI